MKASHPIYKTENEALTERDRQKRLNRTVSLPWKDDGGYWRLTILHTAIAGSAAWHKKLDDDLYEQEIIDNSEE